MLGNSKTIDSIVTDIEELLVSGIEVPPEKLQAFGNNLAMSIAESLSKRERKASLRMSNIGKPDRQLYYEVNSPHLAENMKPELYMKFMYGHLIEELILFLAELAGHEVTGRQGTQEIQGIEGHRDAIIDGVLVDVKSASSYSFKKFKDHRLSENDPFGYIPQLQSYLYAGQEDPKVTDKSRAAFLVVDKTLGHLTLDIHGKDETDWPEFYDKKKEMINSTDLPDRCYEAEPMGSSGNMMLGTTCGYCDFKRSCWPGLRTFLYSNKPIDLVEVSVEPRVSEIK